MRAGWRGGRHFRQRGFGRGIRELEVYRTRVMSPGPWASSSGPLQPRGTIENVTIDGMEIENVATPSERDHFGQLGRQYRELHRQAPVRPNRVRNSSNSSRRAQSAPEVIIPIPGVLP